MVNGSVFSDRVMIVSRLVPIENRETNSLFRNGKLNTMCGATETCRRQFTYKARFFELNATISGMFPRSHLLGNVGCHRTFCRLR